MTRAGLPCLWRSDLGMIRYFFDLQDGNAFIKDNEGVELLDIADAQMEAAETLADMAKDLSMRSLDPSGHPMAIEVRDADGPLFSISFAFSRRTQ
jgi:hypothetical protein